jgi:putative ABC transport system permease protein
MTHYMALVSKYLIAHKKNTRLIILSIAISVALITGIFSMLDVAQQYEKMQVIHDYGNFHLSIKDATDKEISVIRNRVDVENCGRWMELEKGSVKGVTCSFGALDEGFAANMNIKMIEGTFPRGGNEIMVEKWASGKLYLDVKVKDIVKVPISKKLEKEYVISGIFNDLGNMKAQGMPGVITSIEAVREIAPEIPSRGLVEIKKGVNILQAEKEIKESLKIEAGRVGHNERLLAVIGQSRNNSITSMYLIGAILFFIVLIAGVVMIYNTFNISVMDRVRQFGLLRCIGASRTQIGRLVRREGLVLALKAIPVGVLAGLIITLICSAVLKYYNANLFGNMTLINFSLPGMGAGILVGFLTVFTASILPARKASCISPVYAVSCSNEIKPRKKLKKGLLTKILHVETAMGINNASIRKKTLFLMSCSIALSIIMFLGFQVFVDFMYGAVKTTKPYTADISIMSKQGLDNKLTGKLTGIDGVKRVYGRMFGYVEATFAADRLTEKYKQDMGGIRIRKDGTFDPPEGSWLISYDKDQLKWAKQDLLEGILDEEKMNAQNGVIAVALNLRKNISSETANLNVGDMVNVKTASGVKQLKVMGVLRSVPFGDSKLNLATFITTEKLFTKLTGESSYRIIDIQVNNRTQDRIAEEIKGLVDKTMEFRDFRQQNKELDQTFLTMAVFIYGFIALIGLISVLNIINTMNTSVASKTRYLGVMRAVGMSGEQLNKMVLTEAATYSIIGSISGCILGVFLQKILILEMPSQLHLVWKFPGVQVGLLLVLTLIATAISVMGPLERVKSRGISEVVSSL